MGSKGGRCPGGLSAPSPGKAMIGQPFSQDLLPHFDPLGAYADDGFNLPRVGFEFHREKEETLHDGAGTFGQILFGKDQELQPAKEVVGDRSEGIPGVVGSKAVARRMVQPHVAQDLAKATFAFAFEPVTFEGRFGLGGGGASVSFDFYKAVLPEHVVFTLVTQDGVETRTGATLGLVFDPVVGDEVFLAAAPRLGFGWIPGGFGKFGGGTLKRSGPFVVADAVAGEVILGVVEVVSGT